MWAPSGRAEKASRCEWYFPNVVREYLTALHCSITVSYHCDFPMVRGHSEAKDSRSQTPPKMEDPIPPSGSNPLGRTLSLQQRSSAGHGCLVRGEEEEVDETSESEGESGRRWV